MVGEYGVRIILIQITLDHTRAFQRFHDPKPDGGGVFG
jgi:hypothetical protein